MICSDCRRQYAGTPEEFKSLETRGLCDRCGTEWIFERFAHGFIFAYSLTMISASPLYLFFLGRSVHQLFLVMAAAAVPIAVLFVAKKSGKSVRYRSVAARAARTRGHRSVGFLLGAVTGLLLVVHGYSLLLLLEV